MHFPLIGWIISWLVSALALWIVAQIVPGIEVSGFGAAMIATVVISIVGPVVRFFAFPFTFVTLGLFLLVVNAILLKLAALVTPGFRVRGFLNAVLGGLVLAVLNSVLHRMVY